MDILKNYVCSELTIKNSRFLNELFPCTDQLQARCLLKEQKHKYSDASHVVHAFVLGNSAQILGMSDDGEPSGTAGRPVLDVLKGRKCTNTVLTVTRWFGGTLLGTGGLVKAYKDCAKSVIASADEMNLFEEYIEEKQFTFFSTYPLHKIIMNAISVFSIKNISEEFGTEIKISGKIPADEYDSFTEKLTKISKGTISVIKN